MQPDDILLAGDVAQLARVTAGCVVSWERSGKLLPWKRTAGVRSVRLYKRADVESFLQQREVDQAEREAGR